jgi:hypothetical protein
VKGPNHAGPERLRRAGSPAGPVCYRRSVGDRGAAPMLAGAPLGAAGAFDELVRTFPPGATMPGSLRRTS